jgi:hypothetical protein
MIELVNLFTIGFTQKKAEQFFETLLKAGVRRVIMKLPIHRWFRYSAGFSATWVEGVIAELKPKFEVIVDYNNSDTIRATFQSKNLLIDFLKKLEY